MYVYTLNLNYFPLSSFDICSILLIFATKIAVSITGTSELVASTKVTQVETSE